MDLKPNTAKLVYFAAGVIVAMYVLPKFMPRAAAAVKAK